MMVHIFNMGKWFEIYSVWIEIGYVTFTHSITLVPVEQYSGPKSAPSLNKCEFPVMAGLLSANELLCGFFIIKEIGYKPVVRIVQKVNPVGFCPCVCHFFSPPSDR